MSAKCRQETLEKFSVPIEEDDLAELKAPSSPLPIRAGRRKASKVVVVIDDDDREDDQDFVMKEEHSDGDDFIDDEDDDSAFKPSASKKGKEKMKARGKAKKTFPDTRYGNVRGGNPQVMLISLKVGRLIFFETFSLI